MKQKTEIIPFRQKNLSKYCYPAFAVLSLFDAGASAAATTSPPPSPPPPTGSTSGTSGTATKQMS